MFGKHLNLQTYELERQKSRIRKQQWSKKSSVGYYTEMFLRPDNIQIANMISPQRMRAKAFASANIDLKLKEWEDKLFS
jgi:hypothetical protein